MVRASALHALGRGSESLTAHQLNGYAQSEPLREMDMKTICKWVVLAGFVLVVIGAWTIWISERLYRHGYRQGRSECLSETSTVPVVELARS